MYMYVYVCVFVSLKWSYSLDKPQYGTVLNISWTTDGTQIAASTGSGQIVFGQVVDR